MEKREKIKELVKDMLIESHKKATTIREYLNEQHIINENDIEQWVSGECIPFCVALNEIFPQYQIAGLRGLIV